MRRETVYFIYLVQCLYSYHNSAISQLTDIVHITNLFMLLLQYVSMSVCKLRNIVCVTFLIVCYQHLMY